MKSFWRFIKGILLKGEASDPTDNLTGSLWYNSSDDRFRGYAESAVREIVTEDQSQSLSNKSLDNTNDATLLDTNLTLQDDGDNTKQLKFNASGISTATTRTLSAPDADAIIVGVDTTQTLENKTIDGTAATGNNTVLTDASDVSYDNSTSGLTATDVQAAIDEVEGRVDTVEANKLEGPGTHGDNLLVKTDGIDTNVSQVTGITVDDSNNVTGVNDLTVTGDLTVNGTTTTINTATLDVEDTNITINNGGNDASAEGAGLTVERTGTDGSFVYEDALASKFKLGALGSEVEVADISSSQTITNKDMSDPSNDVTTASSDSFTRASGNQQLITIPDTASPENFVLEDFTQALTNKDYDGGTASNTSRLTLPQDTKSNLDALTRKEATVVYANDQDRIYFDNGTKLIPVSTGSGELNFYELGDAEIATTADFSTGNNATFDGGGTLNGVFSITTTAADLIRGDQSFKYVSGATAGANDNDYIASDPIDVPQGYRGRFLRIKMQYKFDGTSGNIKFVVKDTTNGSILTDGTETFEQFVGSDNESKEFNLVFYCPSDCEQLEIGPQVITGESSVTLIWDDVIVSPNAFTSKNLIKEQTTELVQTATFGPSVVITGTLSSSNGSGLYSYDSGSGVYTILADCTFSIHASFSRNSTNSTVQIRRNGSEIATDRDTNSATPKVAASVSVSAVAGDTFDLFTTGTGGTNDQFIFAHAQAETENVVHHETGTENNFSARITSADAITSQNVDFISSVSSGATGVYVITFESNFFSVTPAIEAIAETDGLYCSITAESATGCTVNIRSDAGTLTDSDFVLKASNQGVDYRHPQAYAITPSVRTIYIKDVKAANTSGGAFTSGSQQTRILNTTSGDTTIASLSSNQFTLPAGEYEIYARVPAYAVDAHKAFLRNTTDANNDIIGSTADADATNQAQTDSIIQDKILITSPKTYEIQHQCATTNGTDGFGKAANLGGQSEVYTEVRITRIKPL